MAAASKRHVATSRRLISPGLDAPLFQKHKARDISPDQIAEERRRGRFAGIAAIVSAILLAGAEVWSQAINNDAPAGNGPAALRFVDRHSSALIGAAVLRTAGLVLLAFAAVHLYRAIKARRPDEPRVVLVMGVYGPIAWAVGTLAVAVVLAISASNFTGREFQTIDAADDAFRTARLLGLAALSGLLALAFWLVKGCLDAMRVGLLNRFMGVLGIVLGPALVVTPFGSFLLPVWLIALGALYLGFWPRGVPPAWTEGRAIPWQAPDGLEPEPLEQDEPGRRNGEVEAVGPGVRPAGASTGPAAESGKRKRKRRR